MAWMIRLMSGEIDKEVLELNRRKIEENKSIKWFPSEDKGRISG